MFSKFFQHEIQQRVCNKMISSEFVIRSLKTWSHRKQVAAFCCKIYSTFLPHSCSVSLHHPVYCILKEQRPKAIVSRTGHSKDPSVWHQSRYCSTISVRTCPVLWRHQASVQCARQLRRFTYLASCNWQSIFHRRAMCLECTTIWH